MAESCLIHNENRGIHQLIMNHDANALDTGLITALRTEITKVREAGAAPILIGSAHPTIFSPGWNMKKLGASNRQEVAAFLSLFNELITDLFSYPGPTAASINGHSVAGGCLLALACDLRIMSIGRARIGLAELNLGVPVPAGSVRVLSARLAPSVVDELIFGGDGFTGEEALARGLVHRITSSEAILKLTDQVLHSIAARPRAAYLHCKRFLCERTWKEIENLGEEADTAFLDCWFAPETQKRIASMTQQLGR